MVVGGVGLAAIGPVIPGRWQRMLAVVLVLLGCSVRSRRIIRTVGRRIVHLDPPSGFSTETASVAVLLSSAYAYALPVSTTHIVTSAVMGVGATRRLSAVRWGVATTSWPPGS